MKTTSVEPLAIRSIGVVKMEDRKRPAMMEVDDSAPPSKRQATTVNGAKPHPDADMPWKEEIEYYQKDAIWRQMREYKREKGELESQVAELEKKSRYHDEHLRTIDSWFSQLLDEVKILAGDTMAIDSSYHSSATSLSNTVLTLNSERFQEHLGKRSDEIRSAITQLFGKLPVASPDLRQLQERLAQALSAEKENIAELQRVTTEKEQLSERLENASYRYMVAEKKLDRAKSAAVAKLEKQATMGGATGSDEASSAKQDSPSEVNGIPTGAGGENAEVARKEAIAVVAKVKEQLEQLEAENKKLTDSLTAANARFVTLSDDDYAKTDLFKLAKSQQEEQIKRINHLEATNNQLREEAQKLQAERTSYRMQMEEESRTVISEVESQIARAETDLSRIRNARDEFMSELTMKKMALEQQRTASDQIKELASARENRIVTLETEIERLKRKIGEIEAEQPSIDVVSMTIEELRVKVASLQKDYDLISNELPSMEAAWKKAQALASKKVGDLMASEEQLSKLSAEKSKADQKYFGAMKAKEAREQENRTLRLQNTKSSEIISQLKEAESSTRAVLVNLEKHVAEVKDAHNTLMQKNGLLEQKITEYTITSEGLISQVAELKKQLTSKDASLLSAAHSQKRAEIEAEELKVRLAETKKSLEGWKKKGLGNQSEEYESLRSIAICTVCRKNFKNTALKTCGHVFCQSCVEERIVSRSRKCPNCGKSFGASDHMRVTL